MIVEWAKQCSAYVPFKPMSMNETSSYLSNCLQIPPDIVPAEIRRFVYRATMGIPRYISNTAARIIELRLLSISIHLSNDKLLKDRVDEFVNKYFKKYKQSKSIESNETQSLLSSANNDESVDKDDDFRIKQPPISTDNNPELLDFIHMSWDRDCLFENEERNLGNFTSDEDSDRVDASSG